MRNIRKPWTRTELNRDLDPNSPDMTVQSDALIYSADALYKKFLEGGTLPPGSIKQVHYTGEDEALDFTQDRTDYMQKHFYYREKYGENYTEILENSLFDSRGTAPAPETAPAPAPESKAAPAPETAPDSRGTSESNTAKN